MYKKDAGKGVIRFSYTKDELFREAALRSAYKSAALTDAEGGYAGEAYALSDDERDAFGVCVEQALEGVRDVLLKMSSGVEDAFQVTADMVVVSLRDNRGYNGNGLGAADGGLRNALVCGVLGEWYGLCGRADFAQEYAARCQEAVQRLHDRMFELRKRGE